MRNSGYLIMTPILDETLTLHVAPTLDLDEVILDLNTIDLSTLNVKTLFLATFEILVETNPSETNLSNHLMKLSMKMKYI